MHMKPNLKIIRRTTIALLLLTVLPSTFFGQSADQKADLYVNLLMCYLLVGHHGGSVDVQYDDQKTAHIQINLPYDPSKSEVSQEFCADALDDMLLLSMLDE